MNDMNLTIEQMKFFSNKFLSRTFHISIDWLWNRNWNAIENKYLIPFTVHPVRQAQYQISKVHRHLESVVGTIKFVRRSFEKSYIQWVGLRICSLNFYLIKIFHNSNNEGAQRDLSFEIRTHQFIAYAVYVGWIPWKEWLRKCSLI